MVSQAGEAGKLDSLAFRPGVGFMRPPPGTVEGLCTASATIFAVGIAFLGYWGFLEPLPWRFSDVMVVAAALGGFAALGMVPFIATTPMAEDDQRPIVMARWAFAFGVVAIWCAVLFSLLGSHPR
jgi:hypothetical protein